jgi:hypothetical protein
MFCMFTIADWSVAFTLKWPKSSLSFGDSQSEIDGEEDQDSLGGWGVQAIESGAAATGEAFVADLTFEPLDASAPR